VAVDAAGDVFVAETGNNAVKEVLPDGTIKTIGSGFNSPDGVAVGAARGGFVAPHRQKPGGGASPPHGPPPPAPPAGATATAISAGLTGLAPGTTYYYRAVATGPGGAVADSPPQSFTTQTTPSVTVSDAGAPTTARPSRPRPRSTAAPAWKGWRRP